MGTTLVTPPAVEPLSLAEAKLHLKVEPDVHDEDALIAGYVKAAREYCEGWQGRTYVNTVRKLTLDYAFPDDGIVELPFPPLVSVAHVKYYDAAGVLTTLAASAYLVDVTATPGRLVPAYGASWPTPQYRIGAVEVQYTAGYGTAATSVPELFRQAVRLALGDLYEHRETEITGAISSPVVAVAIDRLLMQDRVILVQK